ncbi:MAG: hypothetical protein RL139_92, partial [Gemmatimonadota bacterium]
MPEFVKKAIVDFAETGLAAVFALSVVLPSSVEDAKKVAVAIGVALLGAAVSAARRAAPGFIEYLKEKLGT